MDLRWEHHLLSPWHPGVVVSVVVAAILAWQIGVWTARLVLRVRDPWRRVVYLTVPLCVIAGFVFVLPQLFFEVGWLLTHPKYVQADLFAARYLLLVPLLVAGASAAREIVCRRRGRPRERPAVV